MIMTGLRDVIEAPLLASCHPKDLGHARELAIPRALMSNSHCSRSPRRFSNAEARERAALGALAEDTNEARDLSPPEDIRDRQLVCDTRVLYSESVLWVALETSQLHISCGDFSSEH